MRPASNSNRDNAEHEYNVRFETLSAGKFRHKDHRFEWTRARFQAWARDVAERYGYAISFAPVGPEDHEVGPPTQTGIFVQNPVIQSDKES